MAAVALTSISAMVASNILPEVIAPVPMVVTKEPIPPPVTSPVKVMV